MKVIRGVSGVEIQAAYPVVAVGNFDGIHLGHQAILRQVVKRAKEVGGTAMAMSFDPHPVKVLTPNRAIHLLSSLEQKIRIMESLGLDRLVLIPFTLEFSRQKPIEFVDKILRQAIGAREVYVGRNFAFGHGREGNSEDLKKIGQSMGIQVSIMESVLINGIVVSSSRIRRLLLEGDVANAAVLLGRPYELEGIVVGGDHRGRMLGFPTANLRPPQELIPRPGVYAVRVIRCENSHEAGPFPAVAYIGSRPTFGQGHQMIEVYLFDYDGDLYQQRLRTVFLDRVRDEQIFSGPEELALQIKKDVEKAREIHAAIRSGEAQTLPAS